MRTEVRTAVAVPKRPDGRAVPSSAEARVASPACIYPAAFPFSLQTWTGSAVTTQRRPPRLHMMKAWNAALRSANARVAKSPECRPHPARRACCPACRHQSPDAPTMLFGLRLKRGQAQTARHRQNCRRFFRPLPTQTDITRVSVRPVPRLAASFKCWLASLPLSRVDHESEQVIR